MQDLILPIMEQEQAEDSDFLTRNLICDGNRVSCCNTEKEGVILYFYLNVPTAKPHIEEMERRYIRKNGNSSVVRSTLIGD
jgi:hypothetical protein